MNKRKLNKLFELARNETPPSAPEEFHARVLRVVRAEPRSSPLSFSFWDQLDALLPRLAVSTALLVGICLLGDLYDSTTHPGGLSTEVNEISEQWLFAASGN